MEVSSQSRLGPDAWVDAAYAAFEAGGVSAVRIDRLAKALKITRGSFYWHFKDRRALLQAVLDRWDQSKTEGAITANEDAGGDPSDRLLRLLHTCASDDGKLEIGIRAWASEDEDARQTVERIDERRISYMARLANAAGVPEHVASARARVGYLAWLGSYSGAVPTDVDQRIADMDCLWRMMLET
ncbi:MAG: TetR/AcrR family transcriptional regulator [Hyphomonas sp.]|nr:TetR/AcrR family transcriptional regulator [Hyphomonas sp.]